MSVYLMYVCVISSDKIATGSFDKTCKVCLIVLSHNGLSYVVYTA